MKYDKNQNVSLLSAPIPIKSLPERTKVLRSFISPIIKECDCSDTWKCVAHHCSHGGYQMKVIDLDQSYIQAAHADLFIINIVIAAMHRITYRVLDVSKAFQNTNFPIHEGFCVSPPTCYIDWFEKSYPNVPLN